MAKDQFRPVASPVDTVAVNTRTYERARPVAPVRDLAPTMGAMPAAPGRSDVSQLINALSGFSSSIQSVGDMAFKQYREQEALDAQMRSLKDNVSSWSQAVAADPTLADKSPYYRSVYEGRTARVAVQQRAGQLMKEYYTSGLQSSEDPAAINKWFSDKTKDLLDGDLTAGGKEATMDELSKVQQQFVQAHQKNALGNLIQKNEQSVSSNVQTLYDNHAARLPAEPYKSDNPVTAGLKPQETALLNAISGGESAGKYNIRYTPKGGALFDLNGVHPQIKEPAGGGLTSDAAGRYQFLSSTWRDTMGDAAFTPENQDRGALKLARKDYKARTGEDLDATLAKEGFSARVQRALAPTWQALGGNQNRHLATYNASLAAAGGKPTGEFATNSNLPELMGQLDHVKREAQAQGLSPDRANKLILTATANAMVTGKDEGLAAALMVRQADGSPGLGTTVEGREILEDAKKKVHALRVQDETHAYTMQQHERQQQERAWSSTVYQTLTAQLSRGEPASLPVEVVQAAAKIDPEMAEKAIAIQRTLNDYSKTEDTKVVAQVQSRIYAGIGTPDDVVNALAAGQIKDPGTIRDLMKEAGKNMSDSSLTHPAVRQAMDDLKSTVGEPFESGVLANPERAAQALSALRRSVIGFKEQNPKATEGQINEFVSNESIRIAKTYKPGSQIDEYEIANVARKNEGAAGRVTTPAPAAAPAASPGRQPPKQGADPEPRAGVEWKNVSLYHGSGRKALEAEFNAFVGGENNRFALWVARLGLRSKADLMDFYNTQRGKLPEEK